MPRAFGIHSNFTTMRRRSVQQGLPLYSGPTIGPDYDLQKKQRSSGNACRLWLLLLFLGTTMLLWYWKRSTKPTSKYGRDVHENCENWARRGDCRNNRPFMLANCPDSCHRISGTSVDSLTENDVYQDAIQGFAYFLHVGQEEDCMDHVENCESMAQEGKCMENADFMLKQCPKTCLACFGSQTVVIDFGVEQMTFHEDPETRQGIQQVIQKTRDYMVDQVFADSQFESTRRDCRNLDEHCSTYAAMGECHGTNDALQMFQNCAPACQACNAVEYYRRCARRPEDADVYKQAGEMNAMFQRVVTSNPNATVLSQPSEEDLPDNTLPLPWIVMLDDYLSNEECDWLIAKGTELGFRQTSEITDEIKEDGTFGEKVGQGRTSLDAWCERGCEDQPEAKEIIGRMLSTTGMQLENTEFLEILKYNEGGHYERHHDLIPTQGQERCGNRILTLYVFLSDVEEGGELRFTQINKQITPKKGRAVLWQNVLDNDFNIMQTLTFHEALPVKRGNKYGLNAWFHSRNMRESMAAGCCY